MRPRSSRSSGVQEFRSSGVQEFRSSGVQEFRSSGVQEFSVVVECPADFQVKSFEAIQSGSARPTRSS